MPAKVSPGSDPQTDQPAETRGRMASVQHATEWLANFDACIAEGAGASTGDYHCASSVGRNRPTVELATAREKFTMHTAHVGAWLSAAATEFDVPDGPTNVQDVLTRIMDAAKQYKSELAHLHAAQERCAEENEALETEKQSAEDENTRLRVVVDAARKLKFGAYPAHGSGFVTIVTEGGVRELRDAIVALDAAEGKQQP